MYINQDALILCSKKICHFGELNVKTFILKLVFQKLLDNTDDEDEDTILDANTLVIA